MVWHTAWFDLCRNWVWSSRCCQVPFSRWGKVCYLFHNHGPSDIHTRRFSFTAVLIDQNPGVVSFAGNFDNDFDNAVDYEVANDVGSHMTIVQGSNLDLRSRE